MKTGLTLGKFAPLHLGHQRLIECALNEMDHVIVMVYDAPETTQLPLALRAGWLRTLYPTVEVIEARDGPTVIGDTPEIKKLHEDFILTTLKGRTVSHFYSSEFYGAHVSLALDAVDRQFDSLRSIVPISATQIRQNTFKFRKYVSSVVYRDLIVKSVFLGAPCTGKSTIAEHMANHYHTQWMPEYGREYWHTHQVDRRLTPQQLVELAEGHRAREDALITEADNFFFVDTDATTTYNFAMDYHGFALQRLQMLADQSRARYDLFFLCEDDIAYDETWDRSGEGSRRKLQSQIKQDLMQRKTPYISLVGTLHERIDKVRSVLEKHSESGLELKK